MRTSSARKASRTAASHSAAAASDASAGHLHLTASPSTRLEARSEAATTSPWNTATDAKTSVELAAAAVTPALAAAAASPALAATTTAPSAPDVAASTAAAAAAAAALAAAAPASTCAAAAAAAGASKRRARAAEPRLKLRACRPCVPRALTAQLRRRKARMRASLSTICSECSDQVSSPSYCRSLPCASRPLHTRSAGTLTPSPPMTKARR